MTNEAWRSDDFLRLLASLDAETDGAAEAPRVESRTAEQGIGFVPWPTEVADLSSGNMAQWRDRLDWIEAAEAASEPPSPADQPPPASPEQEQATPASVLLELDAIAAELGAGTYRSAAALASMRRIFAARTSPGPSGADAARNGNPPHDDRQHDDRFGVAKRGSLKRSTPASLRTVALSRSSVGAYMNQDILASLHGLRDQLQDRLLDLPEYRALAAIEKAIAEVTEMLGEIGPQRRSPAAANPPLPSSLAMADAGPDESLIHAAADAANAAAPIVARRIDIARYFPRHHAG